MKNYLGQWVVCGALLLTFSAASMAQPSGQDDQRQDQGDHGKHDDKHHDKRDDRRDDRYNDRHDEKHRDDRDHDHGHGYAYGRERDHDGMYEHGRREGWYRRGGYVPVEYRTRYVVTDWRYDRLREPPRGYHWVRSDNGDFLLVAIATGVIVDLILNH
jgi:Ni/Co efflux regulator RcnB